MTVSIVPKFFFQSVHPGVFGKGSNFVIFISNHAYLTIIQLFLPNNCVTVAGGSSLVYIPIFYVEFEHVDRSAATNLFRVLSYTFIKFYVTHVCNNISSKHALFKSR